MMNRFHYEHLSSKLRSSEAQLKKWKLEKQLQDDTTESMKLKTLATLAEQRDIEEQQMFDDKTSVRDASLSAFQEKTLCDFHEAIDELSRNIKSWMNLSVEAAPIPATAGVSQSKERELYPARFVGQYPEDLFLRESNF